MLAKHWQTRDATAWNSGAPKQARGKQVAQLEREDQTDSVDIKKKAPLGELPMRRSHI